MSWLFQFLAIVLGLISLGWAFQLYGKIKEKDEGTEEMRRIAKAIQDGAQAFLKTEYQILAVFVAVVAFALAATINFPTAIAFVFGAVCSGLAGWIGMHTATRAAVRTTEAAKTELASALDIAFSSGAVMGLTVVGLGLTGLTIMYMVLQGTGGDPTPVFGFGFGASSIALFARVGGGIFTKAADVGADLVGKVEAGIPEDDPRNPATIADNVGDNVGDVAGMGADLFESYVGSIIATMAIGFAMAVKAAGGDLENLDLTLTTLPLGVAAVGIAASIFGTRFVKTNDENKLGEALFRGLFVASLALIGLSFVLGVIGSFGDGFGTLEDGTWFTVMVCIWLGLVAGVLIGKVTEHYTSEKKGPAQGVAAQSNTGAATNLIDGLSVGMMSTYGPILIISAVTLSAFWLAGLYGIAIAAVGMLSTLGISLGVDAYGPVADNAGGIAEMSHCDPSVRKRTDALDATGNTTAAIGKGFAIGSAALTALALFHSYAKASDLTSINLLSPNVVAGLLVGAMLPFLFSALTMKAVGRAANQMIEEVRRQFRTIKGIMEGEAEPDYQACVAISTKAALREMVIPGLLAIGAPVLVGFVFGVDTLGGLLAGALASGVMMAIFMSNAGGAWDNAKKYIESGQHGGKGSDAHKAAVVGDTVGDPFKDTSGPSLNILVKLMSIVALVFAPAFLAAHSSKADEKTDASEAVSTETGESPTKQEEQAPK